MNGLTEANRRDRPRGAEAEAVRISERGEDAFARASRHSSRVRRLKLLLPLAALSLTAAFVAYSFLSSLSGGSLDLASASIESGALVMENPELNGFTEDDRPYRMTAARARQRIGGENIIELEGIRASVPVDQENFATIEAARGTYDRTDNRLTIDSEITLKTTSGAAARLQSADIDIDDSRLSTPQPVEIQLDGARIAADSFTVTDGGKVFVFDKRVRVTIDPAQLRQSSKRQAN